MSENTKSEIAAAQKARARFGRLFTKEKYAAMAGCKTVIEVASILRENPFYAAGLSNVSDTQLNRHMLEDILKDRLYTDFAELFGFDYALGSNLYRLAVIDCEIDIIMDYARLLNSGTVAKFRPSLPEFLERHLDLELSILRESDDFNGLLRAVKRREFLHIVSLCRPKDNQPIDLSRLEYLLQDHFCKKVLEIADGNQKIIEIFGTEADFQNLQMILRNKKYFEADANKIKAHLLHLHYYFTPKKLDRLCESSIDEIFTFLSSTPYHEYFTQENFTVAITGSRIIRDICRKAMRFETEPAAILSAYMLLAKNQYDCLTTIIEGIRYSLPSDKIMELLPI